MFKYKLKTMFRPRGFLGVLYHLFRLKIKCKNKYSVGQLVLSSLAMLWSWEIMSDQVKFYNAWKELDDNLLCEGLGYLKGEE